MVRKVAVVAHTHWDREWYVPFQSFRATLVEVLDELLPRLESDPGAGPFLLDGQLAVIDDYLEVRPQAADAIARLTSAGRLTIGPWYVLMDEFLVSAETIVRDLQMGLAAAARFGGGSPVGYLPDMFGHVAQMPQILRQAGIEHAVVWRGVPSAVDRTAFWWRSPDGSTVRAEYLPVGYGIGAHLPSEPAALVRRMRAEEVELGGFLRSPGDPILLMNGTDHQTPQPGLAALLAAANDEQKDFEFELVSLPEYLASAPTDALPAWTGELRSGARANLLMGVVSNRVDVRVAAARAELTLERRAEPLSALWRPADEWPGQLLAAAWREMVHNAAHDSVCACSADEVGVAVLHRYAEARAVGDALAAEAQAAAAAQVGPGAVALNPSARPRSGVVELVVPGSELPAGAQVLEAIEAGTTEKTGTGRDLGRLLAELTTEGWLHDGRASAATVTWTGDGVDLDLVSDASTARSRSRGNIDGPGTPIGPRPPGIADNASVMAEAYAQAGANRDRPLRVRVTRRASQRVAVRVGPVPGFGWAAWEPAPLAVDPVEGRDNWLDNGLIRVAVSPSDGTFSVNGLAGLGRLVDDGDEGDTYNYSPPVADFVVDRPEAVEVTCVEHGPVRGRLRVLRRFRWPAAIVDGRRVGAEDVEVVTWLEVRAGDRAVRVETTFDNRCRDHRLRAWFPLPSRTDHSVAECAFGTVRRGLEAEGGYGEWPLPTFPARRFVTAGGLTVTHEGVAEYEVVDNGWAVAVTVLRATGMLSRPAPAYRPNAAGPPLPVEGPQMAGRVTSRLAVALAPTDPYALADDVWLPLEVVVGTGDGPRSGSRLEVTGAEVSALRHHDGGLELRMFNPSDDTAVVGVAGRRGWLVDLQGRPLEAWDESFVLRPWGLATARLDP
ncbi:hypothetical protein K6U06_11065 [Acidiferrimicrobium sp. IK]|uniref:glycoside hydrolase family 38 N-terminal domain-containing protein n=1 Tax=Acidiferrimicrobium sp. IK TaxID=2871700 RepID=UPI0021CAF6B0|nr:glycoside hydrolase family 38 C-terminal domain-containing protein [Acidiferrimicrobium sp. IK]MCU4184901.1 hypothetical protein [Acidiferrimicrobium sp. IK]